MENRRESTGPIGQAAKLADLDRKKRRIVEMEAPELKKQKAERPDTHDRPLTIIIVDDERQVLTAFARRLTGHDLRIATTIKEAMVHLDCGFTPNVVIADWDLKDGTLGSELLAVVKERFPKARRVLVSGDLGRIPAGDRTSAEEVIGKASPELEKLFGELRFGV